MSTTLYLIQAQHLLELALDQARQERDRGVFEMARGERSLKQLQRLVERTSTAAAETIHTFQYLYDDFGALNDFSRFHNCFRAVSGVPGNRGSGFCASH